MTKRILLVLPLLLTAFFGCAPGDPDGSIVASTPALAPGRVMGLGNSLTAGFMNGGLRVDAQQKGCAFLVARQMNGVGMTFPAVAAPGIGSESGMTPLYVNAEGAITRDALTVDPMGLLLAARLPEPYDNLGVPGALTVDALVRTEAAAPAPYDFLPDNPFFDIVLRNSALPPFNTTMLDQAEALAAIGQPQPLAMMLWLGNNDILGAATSGTVVDGVNLLPTSTGDPGNPGFAELIGAVAQRVADMDVSMVAMANIPSVSSAPYFTAVGLTEPTSGLAWTTDEADVAHILLPAQAVLGPDYLPGGSSSLPADLTLTSAEASLLESRTQEYNAVIAQIAQTNGWALVDVNTAVSDLPANPLNPSTFGTLNAIFPLVPGLGQNIFSAFSLDGIHPSEKGAARVANLFLDAFNSTYGTPFASVDESAVENTIGFEAFVTIDEGAKVTWTREGAEGLAAMSDLFGRVR